MIKKTLVSIITPSFNQGIFIEKTIKSVMRQDYPLIEHIIIDGGSSDNTIEILNKYNDHVTWISEPDRGQADAVNKGVFIAKGEIIGWLNSDDTYNEGAIRNAAEYLSANPEIVMLYGDAFHIDDDGKIISDYPTEAFSLNRLADTCFICQPSVFLKKDVFEEVGLLDIGLQTCIDYEYWIRLGLHYSSNKFAYLKGAYLANSRMYKENKTSMMRRKVYQEAMKIQKKYFGRISKMWIKGYIKENILRMKFKLH